MKYSFSSIFLFVQNTLPVYFFLFCLFFSISVLSNTGEETGFFPVKNFSIKDYNALPQNWAIIQDNRGIIYVGNKEGLLEFDGTFWRKIKINNEDDVRSITINEQGKIFIGAKNEFGYFLPDKKGRLTYYSLLNYLSEEDMDFTDVWKTFCINDQIYFQSNNKIFCYYNDSIKVWNAETEFQNSFLVNNRLYIREVNKGILELKNDSLVKIRGGEFFNDKRIYVMLPYIDNTILSVTYRYGIFLLEHDKNSIKVTNFSSDSDIFLFEHQVYNGIKLPKGYFSIGTFDGIEIIDKMGKLIYFLNKETGLIDENVKHQYLDYNNNLWLSLANGISRIEINSPVTHFNDKSNINGTIESITRCNGVLYIATSVGAYYLQNYPKTEHQLSQFKPIGNIENETWIVKTIEINNKNILLAEANEDIYEINTLKQEGTSILKNIPWAIHHSKTNPNLLFIGVENGLIGLIYNNNKWENIGNISNINDRIENVTEDNTGILWLGTANNGIYKLDPLNNKESIPDYKVTHFTDSIDLSEGPYISLIINNKPLFGTAKGLYDFNNQTFNLNETYNQLMGDEIRYIYRMSLDNINRLWLVTHILSEGRDEIGFFDYNKDSVLYWNPTPFKGNINGIINAIYHDENGITWLGGNEGLFRYDANIDKNYKQDYYTLIRKVRLGQDSTIFYGTYYDKKGLVSTTQPEALKYGLSFARNSLIFEYSAQNIDIGHPTKYSYQLEGYDRKWSEWTEETKKEYTNLPEGEYNFKVKAKNIYNHEGIEGSFEFSITPPWYRTIIAYIGYLIGLVGFIYLIVTQYTKYLRQIIRENTAEIIEQKDEIEKQKDEITSSIVYAQRIQKAVCPTPERAEELLPEHFVLWRPRDIVSGDYWWMTEKNGLVAIIAADCTGHGVPGAFMSMLGISFLNEIVNKMEEMKASEILNQLRASVKITLKQTGKEGEQKDGMDLALVILDQENMKIQYAGAYNPLYLYRNGELQETKPDKNPIGIFIKELDSFTNHDIDVQKGDTIYTFSDGYVDQFGGEKGGKFKTKKFKQLLADIQNLPMKDQKELLNQTIDQWRGDLEQVDDIIVVGIRF